MAAVLNRVPVDAISAEAREVRPGRALLTILGALFFAIGWCAARAVLSVAWCAAAVKLGWREGRQGAVSRGAG